jgi:hypothetical protein
MQEGEIILVELMNEGTACWRPVSATRRSESTYQIQGPIPEDEEWQFRPGDTVKCVSRRFQDGSTGLVATELSE